MMPGCARPGHGRPSPPPGRGEGSGRRWIEWSKGTCGDRRPILVCWVAGTAASPRDRRVATSRPSTGIRTARERGPPRTPDRRAGRLATPSDAAATRLTDRRPSCLSMSSRAPEWSRGPGSAPRWVRALPLGSGVRFLWARTLLMAMDARGSSSASPPCWCSTGCGPRQGALRRTRQARGSRESSGSQRATTSVPDAWKEPACTRA